MITFSKKSTKPKKKISREFVLTEKQAQMIQWDDYWKNYSISKAERWMVEERHKVFNQYIDKLENTQKKIIEIGCGFGSNIKLIKASRNDVECHALDYSEIAIDKVKDEIPNSYIADCMDTKLPTEKFDFIYSAGLMEHFKDEVPFLKEMGRILNTDGFMVTYIPARFSIWQLYQLVHFGNWQHGYEKAYSYKKLVKLFSENGFKIIDIIGNDPFSLNATVMKIFNKRIEPFIKKSPLKSGYTELGIIVKKK